MHRRALALLLLVMALGACSSPARHVPATGSRPGATAGSLVPHRGYKWYG
jgi:hypothetical protein